MPNRNFKSDLIKLSRVFVYLKPYWFREVLVLLCMIVSIFLTLPLPLALKYLIDSVFISGPMKPLNLYFFQITLSTRESQLFWVVILVAVAYLAEGLFLFLRDYLYTVIGSNIIANIREKLFDHVQTLSLRFFHREQVGTIMSRILNDVMRFQDLITSTLLVMLTDFFSAVIIMAILLKMNWQLSLISFAIFPLFVVVIKFFASKVRQANWQVMDKISQVSGNVQESLSAIRLIKSFSNEKLQTQKLSSKLKEMVKAFIRNSILTSSSTHLTLLLAMLGPLLLLWLGGSKVINGTLSLGTLIAFYTFLGRLYGPVQRLATANIEVQGSLAAIDRVFEYFDLEPEEEDLAEAIELKSVRGDIVFENVNFSYNGEKNALENINLEIKSGESVALVGPSGSGKSTLINLLLRFYDPNCGKILLDGIDLKKIKIESLRKNIGVVDQEAFLFNASLKENISYGKRDASLGEIKSAAKAANIYDFIESLPEKYETVVGERGVKLSGGEKQRITIARAILKNPKILILDEATSSLDSESEGLIQQALKTLLQEKTSLVIAHRLSTILSADKIIVLEDGKIVEAGQHFELLEKGGVYRKLYDEQFKPALNQ
jgi:subfamily B ATP-binding cassette protein MsbA